MPTASSPPTATRPNAQALCWRLKTCAARDYTDFVFLQGDGMDGREIITLADRLGIGICWDTGHGNISGQPQFDSITAIGERLRMVHLNDNHDEDDIHLAPFLGTIKWEKAMSALRKVGYKGSLNLEVACTRLPEALRESYAAYMGKAVRELERLYSEG